MQEKLGITFEQMKKPAQGMLDISTRIVHLTLGEAQLNCISLFVQFWAQPLGIAGRIYKPISMANFSYFSNLVTFLPERVAIEILHGPDM